MKKILNIWYYETKDVMEALNVSRVTVCKYVKQRKLIPHQKYMKGFLFTEGELQRFFDGRYTGEDKP